MGGRAVVRAAIAVVAPTLSACLMVGPWAPASAAAPQPPSSTTTTAASPASAGAKAGAAPAGASSPPPIPKVPLSVTDGQPASALLARALELTAAASSNQSDLQALGQVTAQLDEATITARQASAAAARAQAVAEQLGARLRSDQESYRSLMGALRDMAVRMYETGADGTSLKLDPADPGQGLLEQVYAQATIAPQGLLSRRRNLVRQAAATASAAERQSHLAEQSAVQAAAAVTTARSAAQEIRQTLTEGKSVAGAALANERLTLAQQASQYATHSTSLQFTPASPVPPPVATADTALEWAFSELGKPYLWGGTGPDEFDCSGLTQYVWHKAGVDTPRVAADQDSWSIPVPLSELLPGDLVFFGTTDIHHVGIYIGDGLMINAPHTGAVVSVSPIWWSDLNGFGRVHAGNAPVPPHSIPTPSSPAKPQVVAAPGPVPSQSKPPAGWKPAPGQTAPMPGYMAPTTSITAPTSWAPATSTTVPTPTSPPTTLPVPTTIPVTTTTTSPPDSTTSTSTSTTDPGASTTSASTSSP